MTRSRAQQNPAQLEPVLLPVWRMDIRDLHEVSGLLVVPLVASASVVGILSLWRERPRGIFDDWDTLLVQEVARRLALA